MKRLLSRSGRYRPDSLARRLLLFATFFIPLLASAYDFEKDGMYTGINKKTITEATVGTYRKEKPIDKSSGISSSFEQESVSLSLPLTEDDVKVRKNKTSHQVIANDQRPSSPEGLYYPWFRTSFEPRKPRKTIEIVPGEREGEYIIYGIYYSYPVKATFNADSCSLKIPSQVIGYSETMQEEMELRFDKWVTDPITNEDKCLRVPEINLKWDSISSDGEIAGFSSGEDWDVCFSITTESLYKEGRAFDYYYALHLEPMDTFIPRCTPLEDYFTYIPEEWHSVGEAEFSDPWIYNRDDAWKVECKVNKRNRNLVLLYHPYLSYSATKEGVEEGFILFDVTDRNCVLNVPCVYSGIDFNCFQLPYITPNPNGYGYHFYACNSAGYKHYYQGLDYSAIKEESNNLSSLTPEGIININDYLIGCSYNAFGEWKWYIDSEQQEYKGYVILPQSAINYINGTDLIDWQILKDLKDEIVNMGGECSWDTSGDSSSASDFAGLTVKDECVIGMSLHSRGFNGPLPLSAFKFPYLTKLDLSGNEISDDFSTLAALLEENPDIGQNLKTLDLSNNRLTGNLSEAINKFPALTTLNVSGNCLSEIKPPLSKSISSPDFSNQTSDKTVDLDVTNPGGYFIEIPTAATYRHYSQDYPIPTLTLTAPSFVDEAGNERGAWKASLGLNDKGAAVWSAPNTANSVFYGKNEEVILATGRNNSTFKTRLIFPSGDANFDGTVDITDLQDQINYIFENPGKKPFNFTAADLIDDDYLNVRDVVAMVNMLMDDNSVEQRNRARRMNAPSSGVNEAWVFCNDEGLFIASERPVAAFDIILDNTTLDLNALHKPTGFTIERKNENGTTHLIGYSLSGETIPAGRTLIADSKNGYESVVYAALADAEAERIPTALCENTPSSVQTVGRNGNAISISSKGATVTIANASGQPVAWAVYTLDGSAIAEGVLTEKEATVDIPYTGVALVKAFCNDSATVKKIKINQQ